MKREIRRVVFSFVLLVLLISILYCVSGLSLTGKTASQSTNVSVFVVSGVSAVFNVIPPEGIFQPHNPSLSLTQESVLSIRLVNFSISPSQTISCRINQPNGNVLNVNKSGLSFINSNYSLNYTVGLGDPIVNDASAGYLPWVLKGCTIFNSNGSIIYAENITSRIYLHNPVYWTDEEITRAVACAGSPGKYFNNTVKCEYLGDTKFALQMRNGNPVTKECFNNPGVACGSDYCNGIAFPTCNPPNYFGGYSALTDDPNGFVSSNVVFAGYNTQVYYSSYVNSSGNFKFRMKQTLSDRAFSLTLYNLTHVSSANIYGAEAGNGSVSVSNYGDGTWNVAFDRLSTRFTGTLDLTFNISFNQALNEKRSIYFVIAYGSDTNQMTPAYFIVNFSTANGLRNNDESEMTSWTNDLSGTCGDRANNDFDYLGTFTSPGVWENSYDCFDPNCNGKMGDYSQTNEFGTGKIGLCNYLIERNCTDKFDNDYDYLAGLDYTDCHDNDCFHNASAGCPLTETVCNDGINNDWDYALGNVNLNGYLYSSSQMFNASGHKYDSTHQANVTDCQDSDCNNLVGGPSGQLCNYQYETTCNDGFDNNANGIKDCDLVSAGSATIQIIPTNAEYSCSSYCKVTNNSVESGNQCFDNLDNDWDAIILDGPYVDTFTYNLSGGIDCRWGGYFGIGTNYRPDSDCDNQTNTQGKQCQLMRERNCSDSFDNDFDHDGLGMLHAGWSLNTSAYQTYFNQSFTNYADYDDYDCKSGSKAPSSEGSNSHPGWCFDGIDNNLDAYYFNGTAYVQNLSTGIDCADPNCIGVTNPANHNQTCLTQEYNSTNSFFSSLANPGFYCNNGFDDDVDNWKGWPLGGIDCRDPDCNKKFGMCDSQCYSTENISWNSCSDSLDNNFDMPTPLTDCQDPTCSGMTGSSSGALCSLENSDMTCSDTFDNNANGLVDCADSGCYGFVGGKINGNDVYCRASENTSESCYDGFDNDANGFIDCYDSSCNLQCGLSDISGISPISLPQYSGQINLNSILSTDAIIEQSTSEIRATENYSITLKGVSASSNAQWTLGTTYAKFDNSYFDDSSKYLSGPDSGDFSLTETANGWVIQSTSAHSSGYRVIFNIKSSGIMPSSTYELTYSESTGSLISLNNPIVYKIDENTAPVADKMEIIPNDAKVVYGSKVYMRGNISDSNALGACRFSISGVESFDLSDVTSCKSYFVPAVEGAHTISLKPVDYYSNAGSSINKAYNVDLVPAPVSISIGNAVPYYKQSSLLVVNATFNVPLTDTLGNCQFIAQNDSGYEFNMGTYAASGKSCYVNGLGLSSLADGAYRIYAKATETTEADNIISNKTEFFVCSGSQGMCYFADFNANGMSDVCEPVVIPPTPGGGGGQPPVIPPKENVSVVEMKLIVPPIISLKDTGKVNFQVHIKNSGDVTLNNISIGGYVIGDSRLINMPVTFDRTFIASLEKGKQEKIEVTIDVTNKEILFYEIVIAARSENPVFEVSDKVFVNYIGKNITNIENTIALAETLVAENDECANLQGMLDDANAQLAAGNLESATNKAQAALEACKRITERLETPQAKIISAASNTVKYAAALGGIVLVLVLAKVLGPLLASSPVFSKIGSALKKFIKSVFS